MTVAHDTPAAKYAVIFDPLDGSSNIDVAGSVGTTFSILRRPAESEPGDVTRWVLQPGSKQVAAGYVVYGPQPCWSTPWAAASTVSRSIRRSGPMC